MCGISGIIYKNNNNEIQHEVENEIKKMNDLISHRGPDDAGFFFGENFAVAHRRLSIIDLSSCGSQPMGYMDDRYLISYNGEIYNYLEIRKVLKQYGYVFHTNTDTEVILAAYAEWGEKCVDKFNGMWAFAIFDKEKKYFFCSRDRFGIKPFYYTEVGGKFVFGSEIKQLLDFQDKVLVNKEILIDYIVTSIQEHTNQCFFENIYRLEAGCNLTYKLENFTYDIHKYYEISLDNDVNKSLDDSVADYKKCFERSVNYRLRSDVKVGSCLSGGLDSSAVCAVASKLHKKNSNDKFVAIHAKSMDKNTDESNFAKNVSDHLDLDLKIIEPTFNDFKENINNVVYIQEEPFGNTSIFMQYFVMKLAKKIGCKVMLDGQGGDETLLGYEKYFPSIYYSIYKKYGIIQALRTILESKKNNKKMNFFWIIKYTIGSFFPALRIAVHLKDASFLKANKNKFIFLYELANKYRNIKQLQQFEVEYTSIPVLLKSEDKNSMANSIEARVPFLDFHVLENALNIETDYKIRKGWTKYILRKSISEDLPFEIVWRKNKLGFNSPEDTWMNTMKNEMKEEILNSVILNELCNMDKVMKKITNMDNYMLWRLFNIAIWEKVYKVGIN